VVHGRLNEACHDTLGMRFEWVRGKHILIEDVMS